MSFSTFDEYPRGLKDDDPILIDNWKILHVIGAGGMGKVFSGVSKDHTYVIKRFTLSLFGSILQDRYFWD
jgi:hypothetical protein